MGVKRSASGIRYAWTRDAHFTRLRLDSYFFWRDQVRLVLSTPGDRARDAFLGVLKLPFRRPHVALCQGGIRQPFGFTGMVWIASGQKQRFRVLWRKRRGR